MSKTLEEILNSIIKKSMDRGIQLGIDNANKRNKVVINMTDIRTQARQAIIELFKKYVPKGKKEKYQNDYLRESFIIGYKQCRTQTLKNFEGV